MDRSTAIFVDGLGAAAATSGILSQLQGRIFALLYLQPRPVALEDIAAELEQSKSNVSVNIRGLIAWNLPSFDRDLRRVDAGIEGFARGEPITPQAMQVIHIKSGRKR